MDHLYIKEACVGSLSQAILAETQGAHQVELCVRLDLDGNSPPLALVGAVCSALSIPVKVIVNPFPYRYIYSNREMKDIAIYIKDIMNYSIGGIVFGPITLNGLPDLEALKLIREFCSLPITFHKAIDHTNIIESLDILKSSELVDFVLSSGGCKNAIEGKVKLSEMKKHLDDSDIDLIAAGSITDKNIEKLHQELDLNYYHGKLIVGSLGE